MKTTDRDLAAHRVSAFLTAPSWARSPYAGQQARDIVALVMDVKPCRSVDPNSTLFEHICYLEDGHEGSRFSDGSYSWDLPDEERYQDEIDKSIAEHLSLIHI